MKTVVISLGGSLIVPDKVDYAFLKQFEKIIKKHKKNYKFLIVTGGGKTARTYIEAVQKEKLPTKLASIVGILSTRINARLVAGFFKQKNIPETISELKKQKTNPIICGALGSRPGLTSDANAAELASHYKATFINMTNVKGLYNKDPKLKGAKFIPQISYKDFNQIIEKIKYKAGQHFVLDQVASKIIMQHKVPTVILKGNKQLNLFLSEKKYQGTIIS